MSSDDVSATTADGFGVTLNAADLLKAAEGFKAQQGTAYAARGDLLAALVPDAAFGTIPNGPAAAARLKQAMNDHIDAMTKMGLSVSDLAARVQAAAHLAEQAEPDTAKVARIPDPFTSSGG